MTTFPPGWYPDPDDPTARRYWDGANWSAPLPATTVVPSQTEPAPPKAGWELAAMERGTATPVRSCAVPPCGDNRLPGSDFCGKHGPRGSTSRAASSTSASLICPHCQTQGRVTSKQVKMKKGVSGGKLTGAVLTAGISMLGTGLSRKEKVTEMKCGNCKTVWHV